MTRTYNGSRFNTNCIGHYNLSNKENPNKNDGTGEIIIDAKKYEKLFKIDKLYYVKYTNCPIKNNQKKYFCGTLKKKLENSYIFDNVNHFLKMMNHRKCKLTVPINWVDMIDLYKIFPNIPLDIIFYEIMEFL
jgi:hypothetical protein